VKVGNPKVIAVGHALVLVDARQAEGQAAIVLNQFGIDHIDIKRRIGQDVVEALTGKSAASDLIEGKNSLPVLAGLGANGKFARRWRQGPVRPDEVQELARLLVSEGGYEAATDASRQMTDLALLSLREADPQGEAGQALFDLADMLLKRNQ